MEKRDNSIVIIRLLATVMLLFTHLCQFYDWVAIRAVLVCVPLFLAISGYLYGKREIADIKRFYIKCGVKLFVPVWIYSLFVFLYSALVLHKAPGFMDILLHLTNMQGIYNVCNAIQYYGFGSNAILWFMTVIMLCYAVTPLLEYLFKHKMMWIVITISLILMYFGISMSYLLAYIIGFLIGKKNRQFKLSNVLLIGGSTSLIWIVRIILRRYIDGSMLYDTFVYSAGSLSLTGFIFVFVQWMYSKSMRIMDRFCGNKLVQWIDTRQMAIYIVHYLFFKGFWSVAGITDNNVIRTLLLLVFTIPAAELFYRVNKACTGKIQHALLEK